MRKIAKKKEPFFVVSVRLPAHLFYKLEDLSKKEKTQKSTLIKDIIVEKVDPEQANRKRIENAIKAMMEGKRPQSQKKVDWDEIRRMASSNIPSGMTLEKEMRYHRGRGLL